MKKLPYAIAFCVAALMLMAGSCSKENSASGNNKPIDSFNLVIYFKPMADTLPLKYDSVYRNVWKEKYSVSNFKYYISHITLTNSDSNVTKQINDDKYFLVDAADSAKCLVKLSVAPYRFNRISFTIGVDSARCVSGAQTGALDPANGMFWTWTSGYVMAKLEGTSSVSSLVNNKMEYHIGGFRGDSSVLRKPVLLFPYGQYLQISAGSKASMVITANVNAWFYNPHDLKIANTPSCTTPGQMAVSISENYSRMFTVTTITN
ncbi:MAG: hypothetical protein JST39_15450 [Bacteroidetes bacterium]|nr:hypothetical protein [Bacteroidota bacterium]